MHTHACANTHTHTHTEVDPLICLQHDCRSFCDPDLVLRNWSYPHNKLSPKNIWFGLHHSDTFRGWGLLLHFTCRFTPVISYGTQVNLLSNQRTHFILQCYSCTVTSYTVHLILIWCCSLNIKINVTPGPSFLLKQTLNFKVDECSSKNFVTILHFSWWWFIRKSDLLLVWSGC